MAKTILIVDDKQSARVLLRDYLSVQGFRVVTAEDGRKALLVAKQELPDLILLDIMMPEIDGYEFMRLYRREFETPIILVTAKLEETDKVIGLELGADDYVTKPYGMAELTARIRAVLRRTSKPIDAPSMLRVGDVSLDRSMRNVNIAGRVVELTPSEFELLALFMASPGRVFSRAELLEQLQGDNYERVERTIDVHVRNLRSKIELDPARPQYVQTVFGVGYRFRAANEGSAEP